MQTPCASSLLPWGLTHQCCARTAALRAQNHSASVCLCCMLCVRAASARGAASQQHSTLFLKPHLTLSLSLVVAPRFVREAPFWALCDAPLPPKPPPITSTNTLPAAALSALGRRRAPPSKPLLSFFVLFPLLCRSFASRRLCAAARSPFCLVVFFGAPKLPPRRAYALLFCLPRARGGPGSLAFSLRAKETFNTFAAGAGEKRRRRSFSVTHTRVVKRQFLSLFFLEISSRQHAAATVALRMGGGTAQQETSTPSATPRAGTRDGGT